MNPMLVLAFSACAGMEVLTLPLVAIICLMGAGVVFSVTGDLQFNALGITFQVWLVRYAAAFKGFLQMPVPSHDRACCAAAALWHCDVGLCTLDAGACAEALGRGVNTRVGAPLLQRSSVCAIACGVTTGARRIFVVGAVAASSATRSGQCGTRVLS